MNQQASGCSSAAARDVTAQSHWSLFYLGVLCKINNEMEPVIGGSR